MKFIEQPITRNKSDSYKREPTNPQTLHPKPVHSMLRSGQQMQTGSLERSKYKSEIMEPLAQKQKFKVLERMIQKKKVKKHVEPMTQEQRKYTSGARDSKVKL